MPSLSWNETRDRSIAFAREWKDAAHEEQQKHLFWIGFFECFGLPLKSVAVFERAVENLKGNYSFLDLFWPGVLLVEHKSRGASLDKAGSQAFAYLADLAREGRHDQLPRYVILCDFARFILYDLEPEEQKELPLFDDGKAYRVVEFTLPELHRHVREFAFIRGEKPVRLDPEDPANLKATQLLADLHDELEQTGYTGHALERYLVRLLFCLFAEDTGIFDTPGMFTALVDATPEDGAGLGPRLQQLWEVLNTDTTARQRTLDEDLATFPYVNGGLFAEALPTCHFTRTQRAALLSCCRFYWARISPAVFGSLFQGILGKTQRRQLGAHYTTERDVLKLLNSLFLDDLRKNLKDALTDRSTRRTERLRDFTTQLRRLRIFDPACGCGNFLILAYRELRRLENSAVTALHTVSGKVQQQLDVRALVQVDVDQFYGLEIGEWPVRIAEVGLWLADHQCNVELAEALGQTFRRLPLRATPTIKVWNALRDDGRAPDWLDWRAFLPPNDDVLVVGNPPFIGHQWRNAEQQADMELVWGKEGRFGRLDYVTAWYRKAAGYVGGTQIRCAFVSTNSISQGEQVGILWGDLFSRGIKIHFAHRTFSWISEARGKAQVDVVIIGFGQFEAPNKRIYDYDADTSGEHASVSVCGNISPYLIAGPDLILPSRTEPRPGMPEMNKGSQPTDGGHLLLTREERTALLAAEPAAKKYLRRFMGGDELINGGERWCLWLKNADPSELRECPQVMARVAAVRDARLKSPTRSVRDAANTPSLFTQDRQPSAPYLAVPEVSSENRRYIPMGFLTPEIVASNKLQIIVGGTLYHFGVLISAMHMAWVRVVAGRLESRLSYAPSVYNNYPWAAPLAAKERAAIEASAQAVLDARADYPASTLADLYDPLSMPASLAKAHAALDRAVDRAYATAAGIKGSDVFPTNRARVEHLFALYEKLTAPLLPTSKPRRGRRASKKETTASPSSDADTESEPEAEAKSNLPDWYRAAFKPYGAELMRGELKANSLETIYDRIDDMVDAKAFGECDALLKVVTDEINTSPLDALVGLLTGTIWVAKHLPHRPKLREKTGERLRAAGKDAEKVLQGL